MQGGYSALVVMDDGLARGEVGLQTLPIEAEIGADAWVVRDAKIVIEKKSVDGFHEFERKENGMGTTLTVLRQFGVNHQESVK